MLMLLLQDTVMLLLQNDKIPRQKSPAAPEDLSSNWLCKMLAGEADDAEGQLDGARWC